MIKQHTYIHIFKENNNINSCNLLFVGILQSQVKLRTCEDAVLYIKRGGGTDKILDKIGKITCIVPVKHTFNPVNDFAVEYSARQSDPPHHNFTITQYIPRTRLLQSGGAGGSLYLAEHLAVKDKQYFQIRSNWTCKLNLHHGHPQRC